LASPASRQTPTGGRYPADGADRYEAEMTDPTEEEIDFLRKLERRKGKLVLQGNFNLLKIGRLIPEYVRREITIADTAVFTITENGRRMVQSIDQDNGRPAG
jgi:hypothetical protein